MKAFIGGAAVCLVLGACDPTKVTGSTASTSNTNNGGNSAGASNASAAPSTAVSPDASSASLTPAPSSAPTTETITLTPGPAPVTPAQQAASCTQLVCAPGGGNCQNEAVACQVSAQRVLTNQGCQSDADCAAYGAGATCDQHYMACEQALVP